MSVDISCLRERKEKLPINVICYKGLSYLRFDKSKDQLLFKVLVLINNYFVYHFISINYSKRDCFEIEDYTGFTQVLIIYCTKTGNKTTPI